MEPAAAWDRSCEFQQANWTIEEPVADLTLPVEYASIDIPGGCSIQAYEYDVQQHLVDYYSGETMDGRLQRFLSPNRSEIFHDVLLLENQLPWKVVEEVLSFVQENDPDKIPKMFVRKMRRCMQPDDHREPPPKEYSFEWDYKYRPPHLLGLLRYYIVGRRRRDTDEEDNKPKAADNISLSVSAMDLAEIGIKLKANKTMQLLDMHLNQEGAVFTELSLAPLSLDHDRASYLVNMAAFELCTMESFGASTDEDSAVCSYVMLLAHLVYREEEVQELRERGVLQRGGGLTNKEALRFFTSLQNLRFGPCYYRIMVQIKNYRDNSRMKTKLHGFIYNQKTTIAVSVTAIVSLVGIIGTLVSIKNSI